MDLGFRVMCGVNKIKTRTFGRFWENRKKKVLFKLTNFVIILGVYAPLNLCVAGEGLLPSKNYLKKRDII